MNRVYTDFINDIIRETENIKSFIDKLDFDQFKDDPKTTYAVIRSLEVIGEAANKIPEHIKKRYPKLPWRYMIAMRNKLIHDYFGVDLTIVWMACTEELPAIEGQIKQIKDDLTE